MREIRKRRETERKVEPRDHRSRARETRTEESIKNHIHQNNHVKSGPQVPSKRHFQESQIQAEAEGKARELSLLLSSELT